MAARSPAKPPQTDGPLTIVATLGLVISLAVGPFTVAVRATAPSAAAQPRRPRTFRRNGRHLPNGFDTDWQTTSIFSASVAEWPEAVLLI